MSLPDPFLAPEPRPSLLATLIEAFAVGICAHYPSAATAEMLANLQNRRSPSSRGVTVDPESDAELLR